MINYMPKLVDRATYSGRPRGLIGPGRAGRATDEQIAAWRALARAFAAVVHDQEAALAGTGLDLSEYDVLVTVARSAAPGIRPTDLAERVLLTKSGISRLLDRLEERALLERRACPTDRRGHLVALTPAGQRLLRRAAPGILRGLAAALGPLSAGDLEAFRSASERIREATTAHSPG